MNAGRTERHARSPPTPVESPSRQTAATFVLQQENYARATPEATDQEASSALLIALEENEPNPFEKQTTICYRIEKAGYVRLRIYDLLGRHVSTLVDSRKEPDTYTVTFDGEALSSGVYLYRLETAAGTEARRMTLAK
jgi:hypothetical protein